MPATSITRVALPPRVRLDTCLTTVSLPLSSTLIVIKNQRIDEAEQTLIARRDREPDIKKKREFDKIRLLLKWAEACNASLAEMHTEAGQLKVTLSFNSEENFTEFYRYLKVNVG